MGTHPRIRFGTTCRGPGKIFVRLHVAGAEGCVLAARSMLRGEEVPARVVWPQDGVPVLVLCVFPATQVVEVVAQNARGEVLARATHKVGHRAAQIKSRANTLARNPEVDLIRNCDDALRAGDLELGPHRVVPGADGIAPRLQVRLSYPVVDDVWEDDACAILLRAFTPDGREVPAEHVYALGACVASHERVPDAYARYEGFSVALPQGATELVLWARVQAENGFEGIWRLGGLPAEQCPAHEETYDQGIASDAGTAHAQVVVLPDVRLDAHVWRTINDAVSRAQAACVVLVSAEVNVRDAACVAALAAQAMREDVGVASGVCLFADGTKARGALEVAGLNWRIAGYRAVFNNEAPREVTAACGAFLAIRSDVWHAVGGVSEGANERSWAVDLCLKVRKQGLRVVEVPQATAFVPVASRDLGVASWDQTMLDVAADAWLKQRWPEVLALPDAFALSQEPHVCDEHVVCPSLSIRLTQAIRDGDEDIVRGEVEAASRDGELARASLELTFANEDARSSDSAWMSMGDRTEETLDPGTMRRVVSFSARIPATSAHMVIHADFLGVTGCAGSLEVDERALTELRRRWRDMTLIPSEDPRYDEWLKARHRLRPLDLAVQRELVSGQHAWPKLWITVAGTDERAREAQRTADSLAAQTYGTYELAPNEDSVPEGGYVVRLDAGDELEPDALFWFAREIALHEDVDCVYADEDCWQDGPYVRPFFKPDWDPVRYQYQDYVGKAAVWRKGTDRLRTVAHVPRVLLHVHESKPHVPRAVAKASWDQASSTPLVSIVIPNKDMPHVLNRCVRSVLDKTAWPSLEVVIVENNSELDETFALYDCLQQDERVRVVTCTLENGFNFSRLINCGFDASHGDYALMLNNDTEVLDEGWLSGLMDFGVRNEVGCVGAKLLYPDNTIQHAGVLVGSHLGPWHANLDAPASDPGYEGINVVPHTVRAVTGACLLTKRAVWELVGGMDEGLPVDYNDVDYCLKVEQAGLSVVMQPEVTLRHYESVSRGRTRNDAAAIGFAHAEGILRARWGRLIFGEDPSFNPNFRHNTGRYVLDA